MAFLIATTRSSNTPRCASNTYARFQKSRSERILRKGTQARSLEGVSPFHSAQSSPLEPHNGMRRRYVPRPAHILLTHLLPSVSMWLCWSAFFQLATQLSLLERQHLRAATGERVNGVRVGVAATAHAHANKEARGDDGHGAGGGEGGRVERRSF
eukprot:703415-Pleurochrysis_carterae.AAC.1